MSQDPSPPESLLCEPTVCRGHTTVPLKCLPDSGQLSLLGVWGYYESRAEVGSTVSGERENELVGFSGERRHLEKL